MKESLKSVTRIVIVSDYPPPLQLHLLGPPEVRLGEKLLAFPTRKTLALLIYLALESGSQPREHLAALQAGGLHVESESLGDFHLPALRASDDPATLAAEFGSVDVVLMGVKAYDLEAAARAIVPLLDAETFVLPFLNGVDAPERIGAAIGMV